MNLVVVFEDDAIKIFFKPNHKSFYSTVDIMETKFSYLTSTKCLILKYQIFYQYNIELKIH